MKSVPAGSARLAKLVAELVWKDVDEMDWQPFL